MSIKRPIAGASVTALMLALAPSPAQAAPAGGLLLSRQGLESLHQIVDNQIDRYSGMSIDEKSGTLTVYVTRGQRATASDQIGSVERSADSLGPDQHSLKVNVIEVDHSSRELDTVMAEVTTQEPFASLARGSLSVWYPDPATNKVRVGVTTLTDAMRNAAVREFGNRVQLVQQPRSQSASKVERLTGTAKKVSTANKNSTAFAPAAQQPTRLLDATPYFGGDRIYRTYTDSTGSWVVQCTASFEAQSSRYVMTTAGHCGPTGSIWMQGYLDSSGVLNYTGTMGTDRSTQWGNNLMDAEIMDGGSYAPFVYITPTGGVQVGGASSVTVGEYLCTDGSFTGEACDAQLYGINACVSENDNGTNYTVCNQALAQSTDGGVIVQHGDSGGPAYTFDSNGNIVALGIISGGNVDATTNPGEFCNFTQITNFQSKFGASIVA